MINKYVSILGKTKRLALNIWPFSKKEKSIYNLKRVKIPRASGRALKLLVTLLRTPGIRVLLIPILLRQAGLLSLRKSKVKDFPKMLPNHPVSEKINILEAKKSIQDFMDSTGGIIKSISKDNKLNRSKKIIFHQET